MLDKVKNIVYKIWHFHIEKAIGISYNLFTWVLLRITFVEYSLKEIEKGRAITDNKSDYLSDNNIHNMDSIDDRLFSFSRQKYEREEKRSSNTEKKAQSLAAICGLILTAIAFTVNKPSSSQLAVISAAFVVGALLLLLRFYIPKTFTRPDIKKEEIENEKKVSFKKELCQAYLKAYKFNSSVNSFRVDILRSATHLLIISIIFLLSRIIKIA